MSVNVCVCVCICVKLLTLCLWGCCVKHKEWVLYPFFTFEASHRSNVAIWRKCKRTRKRWRLCEWGFRWIGAWRTSFITTIPDGCLSIKAMNSLVWLWETGLVNENKAESVTRRHSSRMRTARVSTIRALYWASLYMSAREGGYTKRSRAEDGVSGLGLYTGAAPSPSALWGGIERTIHSLLFFSSQSARSGHQNLFINSALSHCEWMWLAHFVGQRWEN